MAKRNPYLNLDRRSFLKGAAATVVAVPILSACGDDAAEPVASPTTTGATTGTTTGITPSTTEAAATTTAPPDPTTTLESVGPFYGGRIRYMLASGGDFETHNPGSAYSAPDFPRMGTIFELLVSYLGAGWRPGEPAGYKPILAESWEVSDDALTWRINLREGVEWHDGSSFGPQDVIYSIQQMTSFDPYHQASAFVTGIDIENMRGDGNSVIVPLFTPNARLMDLFGNPATAIFKDGTRPEDFNTNPIGTGPFVFSEFTPGRSSLVTRNPNYWREGRPFVDEVEILGVDDEVARLNALSAGEADLIQLNPTQFRAIDDENIELIGGESNPGLHYMFQMSVDQPPFDDPRVRDAFRLIPDRQSMVDVAFSGFGILNNDLAGNGYAFFASDLPQREQDLERAAALLAEAGYGDGLDVTLQTSTVLPGFVESATLFAESARQIGVNVEIEQIPPDLYFSDAGGWLTRTFGQTVWGPAPLSVWYPQVFLSTSYTNETHWADPDFDAKMTEAIAELDDARAEQLWRELQQTQHDEGGYIIWAQSYGFSAKRTSLKVAEGGDIGSNAFGVDFSDLWLDT